MTEESAPVERAARAPTAGVVAVLPAVALVFLALTGAGVYAWTVCAVAALLAAGWCAHAWRSRARAGVRTRRDLLAMPEAWFVALLGFMLASVIPLPLGFTSVTGPVRHAQNAAAADAIDRAAGLNRIDATAPSFAMSRNRAGTLRVAAMLVAAVALFAIVRGLAPDARARYLRFAVAGGALVAAAGLLAQWRWPQGDTLWWVIPIPHYLPGPVACFINRNHYAGFLALLAPGAIALCAGDLAARRWIAALSAALCALLLAAGIVFGISRGAWLASVPAVGVTLLLLLRGRRVRASAAVLLVAAALGLAGWRLMPPHVRARLDTLRHPFATPSMQSRMSAWRGSMSILAAYPLAGPGANAYRTVYPQTRLTTERGFRTHAENEYVQTLVDMGLLGSVLVGGLLITALRRPRDAAPDHAAPPVLAAAAAGAGTAAAVHALVDFPLHAPLYALTLALLAGLRAADARACPWLPAPVCALAAAAALACAALPMQRLDAPLFLGQASAPQLARALAWAPPNAQVWWCFGRRLWEDPAPAARALAERCVTQATVYDPNTYPLWLDLGYMRLGINDRAGARAAFKRVKELRSWVTVPDIPEDAK